MRTCFIGIELDCGVAERDRALIRALRVGILAGIPAIGVAEIAPVQEIVRRELDRFFECLRRFRIAAEEVVTRSEIRIALAGRRAPDRLLEYAHRFFIAADALIDAAEI